MQAASVAGPAARLDCCSGAGAQALVAEHTNLPAAMMLYFRDDVQSWACKRQGRPFMHSLPQALQPGIFKGLVNSNLRSCLERLNAVRRPAVPLPSAGMQSGDTLCPAQTPRTYSPS